MQRADQDEDTEAPRSRSSSRRNSASLSRRSSIQKEKEGKKQSPLSSAPSSVNSTPKKLVKQNLDFCVTGRQLLKKSDRANSLPGYRRPSVESAKRRPSEAPKRAPNADSRDASLEDDALDLSQVSDFEDTNSKYGVQKKFTALATSTPKSTPRNVQRGGKVLQNQQLLQKKMEPSRKLVKESRQSDSTFCSRDSLFKTSSSSNRYATSTELDYSSVSPEYSGQSSADASPRNLTREAETISPRSQELLLSSCCVSTWQDTSDTETKVDDYRENGEWTHFWANYNNSVAKVPMKSYYDQCPTPFRTENIDLADLDLSEESRKRSPDNLRNLNNIIRTEGLHLTPRETQNIIKCAHILGSVLTKAIERRSKEKDHEEDKIQEVVQIPEREELKKSFTLNLKEPAVPLEVKEEKRSEMTQTDISLPNTKSAPRIFEKILRQLSKTSLEENPEKKVVEKEKEEDIAEKKEEGEDAVEEK